MWLAQRQTRRPRPRTSLDARIRWLRTALTVALLTGVLAACADEGGPSFAPDAATETAVSAQTPLPTPTTQAIDRQPGELADTERTLAELAAGRGSSSTVTTRDGETLTIYDTAGGTRQVRLVEVTGTVAVVASSDASTIVALRRDGDRLVLERVGEDGGLVSSLDLSSPPPAPLASPVVGSPAASSPVAGSPVAGRSPSVTEEPVTRDRLEISPDGRHVVVISREGDLSIVAAGPPMDVVRVVKDFGDVTALAWTGDGTLALVATYDRSRSTGNLTGVPLEGRLRSILRLPADDGRRIVHIASPVGSPDVFYVARSAAENWTAQNNLYRIPLAGGNPSVVLATGLVGPAGAVDRFAVADDGRTVAAALLIPRGEDLTFHSLWVTDVATTSPLEVETGALGLVSRLAWSRDGLLVIGAQRERSETASRLVTVTLLLDSDGALRELGRSESAATPIASPRSASPVVSPVASPAA